MRKIVLLFAIVWSSACYAQDGTDQQLAQYYYSNGEFEKALPYCKKVFSKDNSKFNFKRYYDCLIETEEVKTAEKLLKRQLSNNRRDFEYPMILGSLYESQDKIKDANKLYDRLVNDYASSTMSVVRLYQTFMKASKPELAKSTLDRGRKIFKDKYPLHIQFAEWYQTNGDVEGMIKEYLNLLSINSNHLQKIQYSLGKQIDFTNDNSPEVQLLKEKLLLKIQKKPNEFVYAEMLIWLFIQKKQFLAAIVQAQALDKREEGEGLRVLNIASMCLQNKKYPAARKALKYVVSLGEDKQYYYQAEYSLLNTRYKEITEQRNYSQAEIEETLKEYQSVLDRLGTSRNSVKIILEAARIRAFYANDTKQPVIMLNKALKLAGLTTMQSAQIKMLLADVYVLQNEIWESSLLYMQVDKTFKYEPIGFEAKYKNARIFYYDGDFTFAQSQLDILKQSTTKLIANDAMKLSILITDNYGLDSNFTAMSQFAAADLLLEQHKYDKAFKYYDSIMLEFPEHGLADEIYLRKSQAMQQQGKWKEALSYLENLLKYHAYDILADDALFQTATIYERNLLDPEKATEFYKKILIDHKGSLYTSEARKRLRRLRGDKVEDDSL